MAQLASLPLKFGVHFVLSRAWFLGNFWIIYLLQKGYSLQDAALLDIMFWVMVLISEIPTGYLADWFGRKASVFSSFVLQTLAIILFGLANTLPVFLLSYGIWGFAVTLQSGAEEAWIYDEVANTGGDERTFQQFYGRLMTIGFLAAAISGFTAGPLAEIDLVYTIFGTALVMAIDAIWILTMPETRKEDKQSETPSLRDAVNSLVGRRVGSLTSLLVLTTAFTVATVFWFQAFLDSESITYTNIAIILSTGTVLISLGSWLSDKLTSDRGLWILFPLVILFITTLFAMSISLQIAIVSYLAMRLIRGIWTPYFSRLINQELSPTTRATTLSIIGALSTIIFVSYELFTAVYITRNSYYSFFLLSGILALLFILPLTVLFIKTSSYNPLIDQEPLIKT